MIKSVIKGPGPVLVFIHGFPNNSKIWEHQIRLLRGKAMMVLIDLPGARSERISRKDKASFDEIVAELKSVVQDLKIADPDRSIYLVGHDLGCFFVDELSHQIPDFIDSQVLIAAPGLRTYVSRWLNPVQWFKSSYIFILMLPGSRKILTKMIRLFGWRMIYGDSDIETTVHLSRGAYYSFTPVYLYRLLFWEALKRWGSKKRSSVPTYILQSFRDPFLTAVTNKEANRNYTKAVVHNLKMGHWGPFTNAEKINRKLLTYLDIPGANYES